MAEDFNGQSHYERTEHESTNKAKKVNSHSWNARSLAWEKTPIPIKLAPDQYDDMIMSNADGNGNYQTITFKYQGSTVGTWALTYDASNNVTRITRS